MESRRNYNIEGHYTLHGSSEDETHWTYQQSGSIRAYSGGFFSGRIRDVIPTEGKSRRILGFQSPDERQIGLVDVSSDLPIVWLLDRVEGSHNSYCGPWSGVKYPERFKQLRTQLQKYGPKRIAPVRRELAKLLGSRHTWAESAGAKYRGQLAHITMARVEDNKPRRLLQAVERALDALELLC